MYVFVMKNKHKKQTNKQKEFQHNECKFVSLIVACNYIRLMLHATITERNCMHGIVVIMGNRSSGYVVFSLQR